MQKLSVTLLESIPNPPECIQLFIHSPFYNVSDESYSLRSLINPSFLLKITDEYPELKETNWQSFKALITNYRYVYVNNEIFIIINEFRYIEPVFEIKCPCLIFKFEKNSDNEILSNIDDYSNERMEIIDHDNNSWINNIKKDFYDESYQNKNILIDKEEKNKLDQNDKYEIENVLIENFINKEENKKFKQNNNVEIKNFPNKNIINKEEKNKINQNDNLEIENVLNENIIDKDNFNILKQYNLDENYLNFSSNKIKEDFEANANKLDFDQKILNCEEIVCLNYLDSTKNVIDDSINCKNFEKKIEDVNIDLKLDDINSFEEDKINLQDTNKLISDETIHDSCITKIPGEKDNEKNFNKYFENQEDINSTKFFDSNSSQKSDIKNYFSDENNSAIDDLLNNIEDKSLIRNENYNEINFSDASNQSIKKEEESMEKKIKKSLDKNYNTIPKSNKKIHIKNSNNSISDDFDDQKIRNNGNMHFGEIIDANKNHKTNLISDCKILSGENNKKNKVDEISNNELFLKKEICKEKIENHDTQIMKKKDVDKNCKQNNQIFNSIETENKNKIIRINLPIKQNLQKINFIDIGFGFGNKKLKLAKININNSQANSLLETSDLFLIDSETKLYDILNSDIIQENKLCYLSEMKNRSGIKDYSIEKEDIQNETKVNTSIKKPKDNFFNIEKDVNIKIEINKINENIKDMTKAIFDKIETDKKIVKYFKKIYKNMNTGKKNSILKMKDENCKQKRLYLDYIELTK